MTRGPLLLLVVLLAGCEDAPVPPAVGDRAGTSGGIVPPSADPHPASARPACLAAEVPAFSPAAWVPPRPASGACTAEEIDAYWADCLEGAALPVRYAQNVANHAACAACLSAEPGPDGAGPLLPQPGRVRANVGGCIALAQDDARPEGCGAREEAATACAEAACATCDAVDSEACQAAARSGACAAWQMRTCSELSVAASCAAGADAADRFRRVARVFCGG